MLLMLILIFVISSLTSSAQITVPFDEFGYAPNETGSLLNWNGTPMMTSVSNIYTIDSSDEYGLYIFRLPDPTTNGGNNGNYSIDFNVKVSTCTNIYRLFTIWEGNFTGAVSASIYWDNADSDFYLLGVDFVDTLIEPDGADNFMHFVLTDTEIAVFNNGVNLGNVDTGVNNQPRFFNFGKHTGNSCEGAEYWNVSVYNGSEYEPPAPSPPNTIQKFTLAANDTYDGVTINNFSITIKNSSFSFNDSTENGTLALLNTTIGSFDSLYDIEFRSNQTGGYFNRTFSSINLTDAGSFKADIFQSIINIFIIDGLTNLTVSEFTAVTNRSTGSTTIGSLAILIKNGSFSLNVTALGFDKLVTNFSIGTLQNNTLNLSMGSVFTINLIRESTNTIFDFNSTNSTTVNVFCPNETIVLKFNTSSNISQIINCKFTLMQAVVDYGELGSYFRTLIPSFSNKNITWYLIDLKAGDTAIQRIIKLLDLTGEFAESILTVQRSIGGAIRTMIEQKFDISSNVNLFLVKDVLYSISIDNGVKDIILGNLIPTEAGTQTITLPKIKFVPEETVLGDNVSWSYTFNITQAILRLQYEDKTNKTDLVRFTIFNDTGVTGLKQLFQTESTNNASVTITFNQILGNITYVTELFVKHQVLINFSESRIFYDPGQASIIDFDGWTTQQQTDFKKWFTWLFLGFWGLMFSRRYMGIGMTSLVVWLWLFRTWKWIDVPDLIFGFVVLLAVVGWIVDSMRRN